MSNKSNSIKSAVVVFLLSFPIPFSARSERYHHLASDEDEETNDEESSLEIRQFASWSHRFSKVRAACIGREELWRFTKWSVLVRTKHSVLLL